MKQPTVSDTGFLAARLHGRRGHLAEQERLESLFHIRSFPDFVKAVLPETELNSFADFQRRLIEMLANELADLSSYLTSQGASLVDWIATRFEVENLKLLIRAVITKTSIEEVKKHLVSLPGKVFSQTRLTVLPASISEIATMIPEGPLQQGLERVLRSRDETTRSFYLETALDSSYFQELSLRADGISGDEQKIIRPVIDQQIDIFHMMFVLRGKYHYALSADSLMPYHVSGSRISRGRFDAMIHDTDARASINRLLGYVIDQFMKHPLDDTPDEALIQTAERLAWKRFLRLSNHAFRESHMGLGAVVGYAGIRMVETANLITISEAIKYGTPAEAIRNRLIINNQSEAAYV